VTPGPFFNLIRFSPVTAVHFEFCSAARVDRCRHSCSRGWRYLADEMASGSLWHKNSFTMRRIADIDTGVQTPDAPQSLDGLIHEITDRSNCPRVGSPGRWLLSQRAADEPHDLRRLRPAAGAFYA